MKPVYKGILLIKGTFSGSLECTLCTDLIVGAWAQPPRSDIMQCSHTYSTYYHKIDTTMHLVFFHYGQSRNTLCNQYLPCRFKARQRFVQKY